MQFRTLGLPVMIAGAWLLGACSPNGGDGGDGDDGPSCPPGTCPVVTTGVDLTQPRITYLQDLMSADPKVGTIRRACNSSACHGRAVGSKASLYLGPNISNINNVPIDIALCEQVKAGLLAPSKTLAHMPNMTLGEPDNSFLTQKIDGCQNSNGFPACATDQVSTATAPCCKLQSGSLAGAGPCGNSMPRAEDGDLLCSDERDNVRRWIAQGAPCN
jgi:hypothetical protein